MTYTSNEDIAARLAELESTATILDTELATLKRRLRREQLDGISALQSYSVGPEQLAQIPAIALYKSGVQTVLHNNEDAVSWQVQRHAFGIAVSLPVSAVTVPLPGLYLVAARLHWDANATGERAIRIYNAANLYAEQLHPASTTGGVGTHLSAAASIRLAAGDTVAVKALQLSGAGLDLLGGDLSVTWLGN